MDNSLTDIELKGFFDQLFPNGFAGADVLADIAPGGWTSLPLLACFHPSVEQVFKESLRFHHNIENLINDKNRRNPDQIDYSARPEPTLESIRAEWKDTPINATEEVAELVGLCLWDVFSDNNDVVVADGRLADIGSFRGAGAFLDGYLKSVSEKENINLWEGDYLRFYLGTIWIGGRADLRVVYTMIFRRLKLLGADWVYNFPQMYMIDLAPLREELESPTAYSPSEAFTAQQEEKQRQLEIDKLRAELVDINIQSRKSAIDGPVPVTVEVYQCVYGRNPRGWPPI